MLRNETDQFVEIAASNGRSNSRVIENRECSGKVELFGMRKPSVFRNEVMQLSESRNDGTG
ncbi:MAG: hypothetical protein Rhob2KO_00830 [Rhodopirellula baltica]